MKLKLALLSLSLLAFGLSASAQIYDNATGIPTNTLTPLGLYDIAGAGCTSLGSYEIVTTKSLTQPGQLPTTLANCQVTLDGILMGLTNVSNGRVTFQAGPTIFNGSQILAGTPDFVTGGQPGQGFQASVSVVATNPTPYLIRSTNGVPVPVITNNAGDATLVGTYALPINVSHSNGGSITFPVNGVGAETDYQFNIGQPVSGGEIANGWCNVSPKATLNGTPLIIATEPDGNGNLHPACKTIGVVPFVTYFLPAGTLYTPLKPYTLTIGAYSVQLYFKNTP